MAKALLFLLVTYALWRWWQAKTTQNLPNDTTPPFPQGRGQAESEVVVMVPCAHCGMHVPKNEAVAVQKDWYCSNEHARLSHSNKPE